MRQTLPRLRFGALLATLLLAGCATSNDTLLHLNTQAEQRYASGDLASARTLYTQLLHASPDNPAFWARLGNCNALLGDPVQAAQEYHHALRLDPQLSQVRYNLAVLRIKEAQAQLIAINSGMDLPAPLKAEVRHLLAALPDLQTPVAPTGSPG